MTKTPIQEIESINNNNVYIKRDDLLGESFGGNKYRIACEFFKDMKNKNKDLIIAYGNSRSNLCRVISYLAYKYRIPCYIVSPSDDNGDRVDTFNSFLVNQTDAHYVFCSKNNVADTVEALITELTSKGYSPYYINGDKYGKGNEKVPVRAYYKVIDEIIEQEKTMNIDFDYIFFASGTGMTQAGLIAGNINHGKKYEIIGISIARNMDNQTSKLNTFLNQYFNTKNYDYSDDIEFNDNYLCGGYGSYNDVIRKEIINIYKENGIPMDPAYTGKAFVGMKNYLAENNIENKNVLFIHTGGTPLFFDFIRKLQYDSLNINKLIAFLNEIDSDLPISLSSKVNINKYAEKIYCRSEICKRTDENNRIISLVSGYINCDTKIAYITIIGTLKDFRGKGITFDLLYDFERKARQKNMYEIVITTHETNKAAISLYKKCKYQIEKIDNEIVYMTKKLEDE